MTAYYNEIDPFAAAWLRELIKCGLIALGEVDERSIIDVQASDLHEFTQCHFFAGIGGWSYALRLAGWPDDRPVWTGSCPCQPFSVAGAQRGSEDERHLWPAWFRLISECKPATIFGEQVSGAGGFAWLDHVFADLESEGYAAAAADLPACSVGAPHRRQRLWWVANAYTNGNGLEAYTNQNELRRPESTTKWAGRFSEMGASGFWNSARPIGARPMVLGNGIPSELGRLRGYGNAIVAQVAAEVIGAYMDIC